MGRKRATAPADDGDDAAYQQHKKNMAERQRAESTAGRDIGRIPPPVDVARRNRGLDDPEFFHRTYFPNRFYLAFGTPHRQAIRTLAKCTETGGLYALAFMRGGGKSTLVECEAIRAIAYGLRRYIVYIGATDGLAGRAIKKIYREFETNDLLLADFPEICFPIRKLERITQRARGQTCDGESTLMEITDGHIVLPTIRASPSSGAVIQSFGLTGAIKGLNALMADGTPIRPDLVLLDDCQTRESAKSVGQTDDRERIISDDVLGLAGPQTKMAAVFLCTPIYPKDLTERFIDRDRHPEWKGDRTRMVEVFPENMQIWEEDYAALRRAALREGNDSEACGAFYTANRAAMDLGAVLSWPDRVKEGDLSGIQTAMNLYLDNPTGFRTEYQCEPEIVRVEESKELVAEEVASRFNGVERYAVPTDSSRLTAFIDIGGELLWYAVCAWSERFAGSVIDYGVWPRQQRRQYSKASHGEDLATTYPTYSPSQRVFAGLESLTEEILGRSYYRHGGGGGELQVERCLIDSGWGETSAAVFQFITRSKYSGIIYPSKGVGRGKTQVGVNKWKLRPGERRGYHWKLTLGEASRGRLLQYDPDAWKTFAHTSLKIPAGGATGIRLFGKSADDHELFAEHMAAEYSKPVDKDGDKYDSWIAKPHRPDNDLWDCLVGCAVAASVQGVAWSASNDAPKPAAPAPPAMKFSEMQRLKMKGRQNG